MKTKRQIIENIMFIEDSKVECFVDLIEQAMEEYSQQQVKNLNIPVVSVICECSEKSINHIGPFYKECGRCGKQIK